MRLEIKPFFPSPQDVKNERKLKSRWDKLEGGVGGRGGEEKGGDHSDRPHSQEAPTQIVFEKKGALKPGVFLCPPPPPPRHHGTTQEGIASDVGRWGFPPTSHPSGRLISNWPPPWPTRGRLHGVPQATVAFPHRSQFREVHVGGLGWVRGGGGDLPSGPSGCVGDGSCAVTWRHLAPVTSHPPLVYERDTQNGKGSAEVWRQAGPFPDCIRNHRRESHATQSQHAPVQKHLLCAVVGPGTVPPEPAWDRTCGGMRLGLRPGWMDSSVRGETEREDRVKASGLHLRARSACNATRSSSK